jgi:hypothetical protein
MSRFRTTGWSAIATTRRTSSGVTMPPGNRDGGGYARATAPGMPSVAASPMASKMGSKAGFTTARRPVRVMVARYVSLQPPGASSKVISSW